MLDIGRRLVLYMIVTLLFAGTAMGEVARDGLVAEWHFDGDAKDSSGNGNDGSIYGATFVQGISGQALSFDGVNNYVNVGSSPIFDITDRIRNHDLTIIYHRYIFTHLLNFR